MENNGYVTKEVNNSVCTITFYHPKGNSLPSGLLGKLTKNIIESGNDNAVKVVVLKSAGEKTFCGGASFNELLNIQNIEDGKAFFSGFANVINAIRTIPKFVVCRVQGKVVGGGVGIVAASDYVYTTQSAMSRLSEIEIGIGPFVIAPAVERKISVSAFSEMSIDCEWKTAEWCKKNGLFTKTFPDIKTLDDELDKFTNRLTSYLPTATAEMKKVLWQGTEHWNELLYKRAEVTGKLLLSEEVKSYLNKFRNK